MSFIVIQSLSCVWLFATPWTAAPQTSLSFPVPWSLLKLMSIESVIYHPTISSSVAAFSSCPQSLPASESFPMSQLFASSGQSIGASASVLPVDVPDWFPLGNWLVLYIIFYIIVLLYNIICMLYVIYIIMYSLYIYFRQRSYIFFIHLSVDGHLGCLFPYLGCGESRCNGCGRSTLYSWLPCMVSTNFFLSSSLPPSLKSISIWNSFNLLMESHNIVPQMHNKLSRELPLAWEILVVGNWRTPLILVVKAIVIA